MARKKYKIGSVWFAWTSDEKTLSLKDLESIHLTGNLTFAAESWKPVPPEQKTPLIKYLQLNEAEWLHYVNSLFWAKLKSQAMLFAAHSSDRGVLEDFTKKDVGLPKSYHLPMAEALFEGRWISADNAYAYLKVVARRIAEKWEFEESDSLFGPEIFSFKEELISDSLLPDESDLSEIEPDFEVENLAHSVRLSDGATQLLKARINLGVTRRDAAKILGLTQTEVNRFWKEIYRKTAKLKKNPT
jgi:hypothetical protein